MISFKNITSIKGSNNDIGVVSLNGVIPFIQQCKKVSQYPVNDFVLHDYD